MRSTKSERRAHLRAWASSGMSRPAYCRANGLKYSTFMRWFKSEPQPDIEPMVKGHFVALPSSGTMYDLTQNIEVHFPNGIRLQIHGQLTPSLLKMLHDA